MNNGLFNTATLKIDSSFLFKQLNHVFHTGEGMTHGPSHLNFWMPYFNCVDENTLILLRNLELYNWVKTNYPRFPVAFAKNGNDVDDLFSHLYYLRNVYYSSNTGNTLHTLKFNELNHVFLGHGDSDKSASAHKYFRAYDEIWVAGQAHIDRFKNAGFPIEKMSFLKVGRPSLRNILKIGELDWDDRMTPSFLYLPTWEGVYEEGNYSSVGLSDEILTLVNSLFPDTTIRAKFHPVTGSRNLEFKDIGNNLSNKFQAQDKKLEVSEKETPVDTLICQSNIFICDISAVVSECLAANGPLFVYIPKDKEIVISQSDMQYQDYAYTFSDLEELRALIARVVINRDDYLKSNRLLAIEYILSRDATQSFVFENELKNLVITSGKSVNHLSIVRQ